MTIVWSSCNILAEAVKGKNQPLIASYLLGQGKRDSGLDLVGEVPWGTHFCQFYQSQKDLLDILVPYFKKGLANNEYCIWVTSDFLTDVEAKEAMASAIPCFSKYLKSGQMEIFPYTNWYLKKGKFELNRVLSKWLSKNKKGLEKGYEGLRVSGNPFWIDNKKDWQDFSQYEAEINKVIKEYKLLVLCTYSLEKCHANEVIDVVTNHEFALIKRFEKWELIESAERKKAMEAIKQSETKYQSLFANMIDGFAYHELIRDKNGKPVDYRFLEINDAFETLTGLKKADILGKTAREALPGIEKDPADWIGSYGKVALQGETIRFENYSSTLNKWFSVYAYSPKKGYFAAVFEDITSRKLLEDRLKNFFAVLGHELRNSLTPIVLSLEILEKKAANDPFAARAIEIMRHQTTNMTGLLKDLYDLSKIERGKIELRKRQLEIGKTIEKAIEATKPVMVGKRQRIKVSLPAAKCIFKADPLRLDEILTNLLTNASKYSKNKSTIQVKVKAEARQLHVQVKDNGVGISKKTLPHIFDLFIQGENRDKREGLGVGLYLCRKLADLHGGDIIAESEGLGKGSLFTLKLPL